MRQMDQNGTGSVTREQFERVRYLSHSACGFEA